MSNLEESKKKMKKETNNLTFRNVFDETRNQGFGFSNQLLFFALITFASFALAYVLPYSLLITFPLLLVPSYFAFGATNVAKSSKHGEGIGFFTLFRTYFSSFFFGGYRLLIGFLKALAVFLVSNIILVSIFEATIFAKSAEFQQLINSFNEAQSSEAMNEFVNSFTNTLLLNPDISKYLYLCVAISYLLAALMYIHHIAKHSIKMRRNLFVKQLFPIRQFNFVDRRVRKDNYKFIFGSYIRTCWFIQALIVLAGAGGIVISFFFLKDFTGEQAIIISLFLMFLVSLPFMNYISKLQDLMYAALARKYEETFATLTLEFLTKYKEKIGIAEEDAKKIEEMLELQRKENAEIKEDKEEDEK